MNLNKIIQILKAKDGPDLFEAVCDLYKNTHFSDSYEDGDMLLFQYGVFDWGVGEYFELDLTRQLIQGVEQIIQIRSTFYFEPNEQLRAIGSKTHWCRSLKELDDFVAQIQGSEAYITCRKMQPRDIKVELHHV